MANEFPFIVAAIIVVALIVLVAFVVRAQRNRSRGLRSTFGPEYDRAVEATGDRAKAEASLRKVEQRVRKYEIRPLRPVERDGYILAWKNVQVAFVDNPAAAVTRADELLGEVMQARGYPVGDFDQQAADLSVDHPVVVDNYRTAHAIALRHGRGEATTEDLRQAMVHYRTLFEDLTADAPVAPVAPQVAPAAVPARRR